MSKKLITIKAKVYKPKKPGSVKGTKIELEHTPSRALARTIAGNHEDEFKDYYTELPKMERKLKNKSKRIKKVSRGT
jgi:Skp family chaperone for outer membrane proteins